jgi:hypothetical protein
MNPSNYWCFNWFLTPKTLLIRLNDLIIRWLYNNHWSVCMCCLEFTFLEQSAQWSVPIVRMIMNENKLHVLLLTMNQRSKKFTRFCNGIYQNSMYCNRLKGHYLPNRKFLLPVKTIRYDWCLYKTCFCNL